MYAILMHNTSFNYKKLGLERWLNVKSMHLLLMEKNLNWFLAPISGMLQFL